jgi:hypothetical protein
MRKWVFLLLIALWGFSGCYITAGEVYYSRPLGICVGFPKGWQIDSESSTKLCLGLPSRVSVDVMVETYDHPVSSNGLQRVQATGIYDGWETLYERPGSNKETQMAGASDSYVSVFAQEQLQDQLTVQKRLAGVYYYTKQNKGYYITIRTSVSMWPNVQKQVREILDGFSIQPKPPSAQVLWQAEVSMNAKSQYTVPVSDGDSFFFTVDHCLYAFSLKTGLKNWVVSMNAQIRHPVVVGSGLVYVVRENPDMLYALLAQDGSQLFQKVLPPNPDHHVFSLSKAPFGLKIAYELSPNTEEAYWLDPFTGLEISSQPESSVLYTVTPPPLLKEGAVFSIGGNKELLFIRAQKNLHVRLIIKKQ